jgi:hypothetical protein
MQPDVHISTACNECVVALHPLISCRARCCLPTSSLSNHSTQSTFAPRFLHAEPHLWVNVAVPDEGQRDDGEDGQGARSDHVDEGGLGCMCVGIWGLRLGVELGIEDG